MVNISDIGGRNTHHNSKIGRVGIVGIVAVVVVGAALVALGPWLTGHFDLKVYYGATRSWLHGGELYGYVEHGRDRDYGFTYPPFGAVVFAPLAACAFPLAEVLFDAATVAATVAVLALLLNPLARRRGWNPAPVVAAGLILLVAFDPWRTTYNYGQVNVLLLAIVAADLLRKRGPVGIGVGLATAVKLVPAIFIGYLLLTRRFRAAAIAAGTAIGATGLAWALDPKASSTYWTDLLWRSERIGDPAFVSNQSLNGLVHRLDLGAGLWLALALLVVALWVVRVWRTSDPRLGFALTAVVGGLVSPITWLHHLVWLLPALVLLLDRGLHHTRRRWFLGAVLIGYGILCSRLVWRFDGRFTGWGTLGANAYLFVALGLFVILSTSGNTPGGVGVRYTTRRDPGEGGEQMTTTDYDAPRRPVADLAEDSLEELATRRTSAQSATVDVDEAEQADVYELPGAEVTDEELTVPVIPMRADEFRCSSCFLGHHRSQHAGQRNGQDLCRECI